MTFSIAAADHEADAYGVAIASVFPAVGAVCPWVSERGAVSTQSWDSGAEYGETALAMLDADLSLSATVETLVAERPGGAGTQFHGVTAAGESHAYTGEKCVDWAGHRVAADHTVAGNMLAGAEVVEATSEAFTASDGPLTERLLTALDAGEEAGGDKRGDNLSAAVLVWAPEPRLDHNLRVDRPGDPIEGLWEAYEAAKETQAGLTAEAFEEAWGDEVPESVLNYRIRY